MSTGRNFSRIRRCRNLLAGLLAGWGLSQAAVADGGLVSIDFCADQYLLGLVPRDDIQAVSFEASGPRSFYGDRATGLPTVKGSMEEILLMQPSFVLRTWRGGPRAKEIMDRAAIPSFQPPYAFDIEGNIRSFQLVGEQIGRETEAQMFVDQSLDRLAKLRSSSKSSLKAVYMTPSGFTAGTGTFVDAIIKLAGFDTVAEEAGIQFWQPLPLEKMVLSPPDLIVATFFGDPDVHVSHWSGGRHGVYKRMLEDIPTIHVPSRHLSCSGAFAVDAAEFIRAEAYRLGLMLPQEGNSVEEAR